MQHDYRSEASRLKRQAEAVLPILPRVWLAYLWRRFVDRHGLQVSGLSQTEGQKAVSDPKTIAQGIVLEIGDLIATGKLSEEQQEQAEELLDLARDLERSL